MNRNKGENPSLVVPSFFAYTVRDGDASGTSPAVFAGNTEWLRFSCAVVGGFFVNRLVHLVKRTIKGGNGYVRSISRTGIGTAYLRRNSVPLCSSGDGAAEISAYKQKNIATRLRDTA